MTRAAILLLAATLAAPIPAAAQEAQPTVESAQLILDVELPKVGGVTVMHIFDNGRKSWMLQRSLETSRTTRRCETAFGTPRVLIQSNTRATPPFTVRWNEIASVEPDGEKIELIARAPNGLRTVILFPNSLAASDFAPVFDFLRQHCAA